MSALQLNLGFGDSVMFIANLLDFVGEENGQNVWRLNEMLRYYGLSEEPAPSVETCEGVIQNSYLLCDVFKMTLTASRGQNGCTLLAGYRDTRAMYVHKRPEWVNQIEPTKWGRKYICPDLGGMEFSSDQVTRVIYELSQLKQSYDEWKYFSEL